MKGSFVITALSFFPLDSKKISLPTFDKLPSTKPIAMGFFRDGLKLPLVIFPINLLLLSKIGKLDLGIELFNDCKKKDDLADAYLQGIYYIDK